MLGTSCWIAASTTNSKHARDGLQQDHGAAPSGAARPCANQARSLTTCCNRCCRIGRISEFRPAQKQSASERLPKRYVSLDSRTRTARDVEQGGLSSGQQEGKAKFEVTDKASISWDSKLCATCSLANRALDGTTPSFPRVESEGSSRAMSSRHDESGCQRHMLSSIRRNGLTTPLELDYQDLQSSVRVSKLLCHRVMLDCSHSMILYGEDRFTRPRNGHALSHLIRSSTPATRCTGALPRLGGRDADFGTRARARGPINQHARGLRLHSACFRDRRRTCARS